MSQIYQKESACKGWHTSGVAIQRTQPWALSRQCQASRGTRGLHDHNAQDIGTCREQALLRKYLPLFGLLLLGLATSELVKASREEISSLRRAWPKQVWHPGTNVWEAQGEPLFRWHILKSTENMLIAAEGAFSM